MDFEDGRAIIAFPMVLLDRHRTLFLSAAISPRPPDKAGLTDLISSHLMSTKPPPASPQ